MLFVTSVGTISTLIAMIKAYHANDGLAAIIYLMLFITFLAASLLLWERDQERRASIARHPSSRAKRL